MNMVTRVGSVQPQVAVPGRAVSHNLNGQRLGPKGRATRDRILVATNELLAEPAGVPVSLSAVARRASLGMTSLYLYFNDLTELLLAVLDPVMATAEDSYISIVRARWSDEEVGAQTRRLVIAYHAFWTRHARLLHLRNSMADQQDTRMMQHRVHAARTVMKLLATQMEPDTDTPCLPVQGMVTALMTGLERVVTVTTDANLQGLSEARPNTPVHLLDAEARLMELAILDYRGRVARGDF